MNGRQMVSALRNGEVPPGMKQQMAQRVLDTELVDSLLRLVTERENSLLLEVQELRDAVGLDAVSEDDLPTPEDRKQQIRAAANALATDSFHSFFLDHVAGFSKAEKAAAHAGTEWDEYAQTIIDRYPEDAVKDDDPEAIAASHVRQVHGTDVETFRTVVCEWDDEKKQEALRDLLVGGLDRAEAEIEEIRAEVGEL